MNNLYIAFLYFTKTEHYYHSHFCRRTGCSIRASYATDFSWHSSAMSRCFAALRQLRQIRHSVPASTFQTLVVAFIHSRLDYGNSVLVGLPPPRSGTHCRTVSSP